MIKYLFDRLLFVALFAIVLGQIDEARHQEYKWRSAEQTIAAERLAVYKTLATIEVYEFEIRNGQQPRSKK